MTKLAIMQPYFFPYLGYFSLIKHTDRFILLDDVQFIRHGWIERNRILKQKEGWLYIKVPLQQHRQQTKIREILIDNSSDWRSTILAQLVVYKKVAPNYQTVMQLVESILEPRYETIVELNRASMKAVAHYLGINKTIEVFSQMNIKIVSPKTPDEWALNICNQLDDVDEYWNLPGGQKLFDRAKYNSAGIELKFLQLKVEAYNQERQPFEPGLSIIDAMMFNSSAEVNMMLDKYELP